MLVLGDRKLDPKTDYNGVFADPAAFANPEQMHFLGERGRIGKYTVVIGLRIQFPVPKHQHPARSAESSDVGEKVEMIQCDLEGLHASHGKAGHGTVIAVRKRSEGRINEGYQGLRHIVFERRGHVLHRLQHFGRTKGFAGRGRERSGRRGGRSHTP